jgi:hypothetical protein
MERDEVVSGRGETSVDEDTAAFRPGERVNNGESPVGDEIVVEASEGVVADPSSTDSVSESGCSDELAGWGRLREELIGDLRA